MNNIHYKLAIHFSLEEKIVKNYLYLSKLAAQMVTSTPSETLPLHLYEPQNKNFDFDTLKTLILHAWSIFFNKNLEEKNLFHENPVEVRSFDGTDVRKNYWRIFSHIYIWRILRLSGLGLINNIICGFNMNLIQFFAPEAHIINLYFPLYF